MSPTNQYWPTPSVWSCSSARRSRVINFIFPTASPEITHQLLWRTNGLLTLHSQVQSVHSIIPGATSWGQGCAAAGKFGVYANIKNLLPWIKRVIRKNWRGRANKAITTDRQSSVQRGKDSLYMTWDVTAHKLKTGIGKTGVIPFCYLPKDRLLWKTLQGCEPRIYPWEACQLLRSTRIDIIDTAQIRIWRHLHWSAFVDMVVQLSESRDKISPRAQAPLSLCTTNVSPNELICKYRD